MKLVEMGDWLINPEEIVSAMCPNRGEPASSQLVSVIFKNRENVDISVSWQTFKNKLRTKADEVVSLA